jgi:hypothetical protein
VHDLFGALRKYTNKPISTAVSRWSAETFEYSDAVAYMMYDISDNPLQYGKTVNSKLYQFMQDAASVNGQAFIGMPAAATHSEYTHKIHKSTGETVQSGHSMEEFMDWAFKGVQKHCTTDEFKGSYVGMGVWGLIGGKPVSSKSDAYDFYPGKISAKSWEYFRKPLNP